MYPFISVKFLPRARHCSKYWGWSNKQSWWKSLPSWSFCYSWGRQTIRNRVELYNMPEGGDKCCGKAQQRRGWNEGMEDCNFHYILFPQWLPPSFFRKTTLIHLSSVWMSPLSSGSLYPTGHLPLLGCLNGSSSPTFKAELMIFLYLPLICS